MFSNAQPQSQSANATTATATTTENNRSKHVLFGLFDRMRSTSDGNATNQPTTSEGSSPRRLRRQVIPPTRGKTQGFPLVTHSPWGSQSTDSMSEDICEALAAVRGTIHHPRSLARTIPTWRPPRVRLPLTADSPQFTVTIVRHRAGDRVREFVHAFGEDRIPAYLVTVRFSDPTGRPVPTRLADEWVQRFTPGAPEYCVHELRGETTPTYCWLVDGSYAPLASPSSLFKERGYAA